MLEWMAANWLWIALVLGAGWFLFRRGGMGCGSGGHGDHHALHRPSSRELAGGDPPGPTGDGRDVPVGAPRGAHRRGGCC